MELEKQAGPKEFSVFFTRQQDAEGGLVFIMELFKVVRKEASLILNQLGALQSSANAINKSVGQIRDAIAGISDKIDTFLPK